MKPMHEMTDDELRDAAKRYDIDCPRAANRIELEDLVQVAMEKRRLALEAKARAEREKEIEIQLRLDPQTKAKPAPETLRIMESEKVYAIFRNLDEPGADMPFSKGGTHFFHLWDGFIHVLPECIIDEFEDTSNPTGKTPIHAIRKDPRIPDEPGRVSTFSTIIGHKPSFSFQRLDKKPPKNAKFGVVLNHKVYENCGVPYPEPSALAG